VVLAVILGLLRRLSFLSSGLCERLSSIGTTVKCPLQPSSSILSHRRIYKDGSGGTLTDGLRRVHQAHASRQATTGDWLMVDNAGSMSAPAQEEIGARSLPLPTYSVLGKKIVSLASENNFALSSASS
jgi:hypothetical protein